MKKKSFKQIRDIIYNNPRADRQDKGNDDKIEDENKRATLYDETIREKRIDLIKRMVKGYNKNRGKIASKPEQPELSHSEKRKRKLADLNSRSNSWKGLESFSGYTGENQ
jgi:hypothetical protein